MQARDGRSEFFNALARLLDELDIIRGQLTELLYQSDESERPRNEIGVALTNRQRQVLILVSGGLENKAIATRLSLSESAVKEHLQRAYHKLGVHTRTQAVLAAIRMGIVESTATHADEHRSDRVQAAQILLDPDMAVRRASVTGLARQSTGQPHPWRAWREGSAATDESR